MPWPFWKLQLSEKFSKAEMKCVKFRNNKGVLKNILEMMVLNNENNNHNNNHYDNSNNNDDDSTHYCLILYTSVRLDTRIWL